MNQPAIPTTRPRAAAFGLATLMTWAVLNGIGLLAETQAARADAFAAAPASGQPAPVGSPRAVRG